VAVEAVQAVAVTLLAEQMVLLAETVEERVVLVEMVVVET
jgi:hypothetical protein